jgi:hypothetical protein
VTATAQASSPQEETVTVGAGFLAMFVVHVLVSDAAGIPAGVAADARRTTERVFGRLHVEISWVDPAPSNLALTRPYVIRVVRSTNPKWHDAPSRSLGFAVPGTRVATVVYPRVLQIAGNTGNVALVLGHVMSHELGHLLLRQTAHSAAGLMRAEMDVRLAEQGRLLFTDEQVETIRLNLSR